MTAATGYESNFSRAAAQILQHLATRSGLASWAICRHDAGGSQTLAVVDPNNELQPYQPVPATLGAQAAQRIGAPIALPDGSDFGELIGFGDSLPEASRDQLTAAVRLYANLLGGLADSERSRARGACGHSRAGAADPLTGLATRHEWEQRLAADEALCRDFGDSASVIVIELAKLRENNEVSGHAAGDEELRRAGSLVNEVVGGKHFAARLTGDRFAVLVVGSADDVGGALRQEFARSGISAVIGVGQRQPDGSLADAVRHAEAEIQPTPTARQSAATTETGPTTESRQNSAEALALARALADGEIRPYFQPIVDLRTGKIVTVEALARWQTADGVRDPDRFLPALQQVGLLGALFDHILDAGLARLAEFRKHAPELRLAVNLEFDSKPESTLLNQISTTLHKYQLSPDVLSLELSERKTIEVSAELSRELAAVADLGVQLMLDDFGSGFASLETLTTLPISGVKLDRRFTGQVLHGEREGVVVKAMIALAAEAGLSVIAEGIETQLQSDRLVRMGCMLGQGYLFSLPQPAPEMAAALSSQPVTAF